MSKEQELSTTFEKSSGNVFADMELPNADLLKQIATLTAQVADLQRTVNAVAGGSAQGLMLHAKLNNAYRHGLQEGRAESAEPQIALKLLRAWNSGTAGFDGHVVLTVNRWIDAGMIGPIPFPDNASFRDWAEENGFSETSGFIGFRFESGLAD